MLYFFEGWAHCRSGFNVCAFFFPLPALLHAFHAQLNFRHSCSDNSWTSSRRCWFGRRRFSHASWRQCFTKGARPLFDVKSLSGGIWQLILMTGFSSFLHVDRLFAYRQSRKFDSYIFHCLIIDVDTWTKPVLWAWVRIKWVVWVPGLGTHLVILLICMIKNFIFLKFLSSKVKCHLYFFFQLHLISAIVSSFFWWSRYVSEGFPLLLFAFYAIFLIALFHRIWICHAKFDLVLLLALFCHVCLKRFE